MDEAAASPTQQATLEGPSPLPGRSPVTRQTGNQTVRRSSTTDSARSRRQTAQAPRFNNTPSNQRRERSPFTPVLQASIADRLPHTTAATPLHQSEIPSSPSAAHPATEHTGDGERREAVASRRRSRDDHSDSPAMQAKRRRSGPPSPTRSLGCRASNEDGYEEELDKLTAKYPRSVCVYVEFHWNFNRDYTTYDDPAVIILNLSTSGAVTGKGSKHIFWQHVKAACENISKWMENHATWKDAFDEKVNKKDNKVPWFPTSAQIQTLRYIGHIQNTGTLEYAEHVRSHMDKAGLRWMCVGGPPTTFWAGAMLDDTQWREQYMSELGQGKLKPSVELNIAIRVEKLLKAVFPSPRRPLKGIRTFEGIGDAKTGGRPYPRPLFHDPPVDYDINSKWPSPPPSPAPPGSPSLSYRDVDDSGNGPVELGTAVDEIVDDEPSWVSGADGEWGHGADRTIVVHATPSSVRDPPKPSDSHAEIGGVVSDFQDKDVDLRKAIEATGRAKQAATRKMKEAMEQLGFMETLERSLASRLATSIEQHSKTLGDLEAAMDEQDSRLQSLEALKQRICQVEANGQHLHQLEREVSTLSSTLEDLRATIKRQEDSHLQSLEALGQRLNQLEGDVSALSNKHSVQQEAQNAMQRTMECQKAKMENLLGRVEYWDNCFAMLNRRPKGDKEGHSGGDKGPQAAEDQG